LVGPTAVNNPSPAVTALTFVPTSETKKLILVFKGTLGAEQDTAVAAKVKP
jgi:hypothetical protein